MRDVSNSDDVIDSRDVIARIDELQAEIEDIRNSAMEHWDASVDDRGDLSREAYGQEKIDMELADEQAELKTLLALQDNCGAADWRHGETLIRDSYFKDYAMELADDIGAIPSDSQWPCTCIDWDRAARELRMDYSSVEFDGVTYWYR